MRVVIYDKESGSLSVYNAAAIALDDGYIIIGSPAGAGSSHCQGSALWALMKGGF